MKNRRLFARNKATCTPIERSFDKLQHFFPSKTSMRFPIVVGRHNLWQFPLFGRRIWSYAYNDKHSFEDIGVWLLPRAPLNDKHSFEDIGVLLCHKYRLYRSDARTILRIHKRTYKPLLFSCRLLYQNKVKFYIKSYRILRFFGKAICSLTCKRLPLQASANNCSCKYLPYLKAHTTMHL